MHMTIARMVLVALFLVPVVAMADEEPESRSSTCHDACLAYNLSMANFCSILEPNMRELCHMANNNGNGKCMKKCGRGFEDAGGDDTFSEWTLSLNEN